MFMVCQSCPHIPSCVIRYRVDQHLSSKGWRRLDDGRSSSFTLKWVECKQHIDFRSFREGQQIVNHFPNINLLTTKIGLLESLREYDRKMAASEQRQVSTLWAFIVAVQYNIRMVSLYCRLITVHDFVPVTYRLDVPSEKEEFLRSFAGNLSYLGWLHNCKMILIFHLSRG